jgi:hypothetical protein
MKISQIMIRDVGFLAEITPTTNKNVGALSANLIQRIQAPAAAPAILTKSPFEATHVTNRNAPGSHREHDYNPR